MRKILIAAVALVAMVVCTPAVADVSCASGSICTVLLTQSNVNQLAGVVVTVTIDNTGATTVLSFQLTTNPLTNAPIGLDQIGWTGGSLIGGHGPTAHDNNFSSDYNATSSTGWHGNLVTGPVTSTMDGFGKFNVQGADPASTGGIGTPITMTLAGLVTTFYSNFDGNVFTVHVRYGGDCSGFIGGLAGTGSSEDKPGCVPGNQVPEPGSMVLFGTGLFGLAGLLKRRLVG